MADRELAASISRLSVKDRVDTHPMQSATTPSNAGTTPSLPATPVVDVNEFIGEICYLIENQLCVGRPRPSPFLSYLT